MDGGVRGKTQSLSDWSAELGIKVSTLSMRLDKYNWSVEKALLTPVAKRKEG
jgi:hypothetical protein